MSESSIVAEIRAYAVEAAATCREAEQQRRADLSKRDGDTIAAMLREQRHAWDEKARSYDALIAFIDSKTAAIRARGEEK